MKTIMRAIMTSPMKANISHSAIRINLGMLLMALTSVATASLLSIANAPLFVTNSQKANVLVILDNSNSMDEDATGAPAAPVVPGGPAASASPSSKSEIARGAVKGLITTYSDKINMGLMAYQQSSISGRNIDTSPYDVSYDPANYDATFTGARDSSTKRFKQTIGGAEVYYNISLPFYHTGGVVGDTGFCYSTTANAFNNGEVPGGFATPPYGPWDTYRCFNGKVGTSDALVDASFSGYLFQTRFGPTDSDLAQGITDFGSHLTFEQLGPTWFANTSPGRGYLHVPVADLDTTQAAILNKKLATSQFVINGPTNPLFPLQNAGLTPIEGSLLTAKDYFEGNLNSGDQGGPMAAPAESCGKNFIALMTDGLPSTAAGGSLLSNPVTALADAAAAAAALKSATIGVTNGDIETYVIGFALPLGTDPTTLDQIAIAGGTSSAYQADSPATLQAAFDTIFTDILAKTGASSSAATNSTSLTNNSFIYQARFNSGDWSGQLLAKSISTAGVISATSAWDAGLVINSQSAASRKIITYSRDSKDGIAFQWLGVNGINLQTDATQRDFLNANATGVADGLGEDRVNYLRGDAITGFRTRSSKLGDIIDSSPTFVGPPDAGYAESEMVGYSAFRTLNKNRTPLIYVGANDGMLHGFDASNGLEKIAYVPGKVYKELSDLTDPTYGAGSSHRYFADGTPMVADANLGTDGSPAWKTVLAAGLNAGGQGYYALDITDPTSFSESQSNAENTVLWEFTDEDDADLGLTFNSPVLNRLTNQSGQIARMADGRWALIVGNGYNNTAADGHVSTTGHASLFILFLDGGIDGDWTDSGDYIKIDTGVGSVATPNGLATPRPVDLTGDGRIDVVYAGDLFGNIWKFDLTNPSSGSWLVANSGAPLFTATDSAGNVQPITTAPLATLVPGGDTIIGFATGLYLGLSDIATTGAQTIYGILDSGAVVPATAPPRSNLQQQTVDAVTTDPVSGFEVRISSRNAIDYTLKKGWYMDLPESGERVAFNPILRDGRFVFTTLTPNTLVCGAGGSSWLMELDYLSGGRLYISPFTQVGKVNSKYVSGIRNGDGIVPTPTVIPDRKNQKELKIANDSSGSATVISESVQYKTGRLSWREVH